MTYVHITPLPKDCDYNLDGIPTGMTTCPHCGQPAVVIRHYLGGYGYHRAYRCQANPEHGGPLFWDPVACKWLVGHYETHWFHGSDIVRAAVMNTSQEQEK